MVGVYGHVALQLAKHMGAEVYSTGGGEKQLHMIETLGATPVNYRSEAVADYVAAHTNGAGFDVVFDSVGGNNMLNSFEAAALNGQVVTTVSMLEIDLTLAHFKGLSLHVVFMLIPMLHNYKREQHGHMLSEIAAIADQGKLKPVVDEEYYELKDIAKAHERLQSGQALGKVVVTV